VALFDENVEPRGPAAGGRNDPLAKSKNDPARRRANRSAGFFFDPGTRTAAASRSDEMSPQRLEGRALRLGEDDASARRLLHPRFYRAPLTERVANLCASPRANRTRRPRAGDLVVVDGVFGSGAADPAVAEALAATGLAAIVARDFDPSFARAAADVGLLLLVNSDAASAIESGHRTRVDIETGLVHDVDSDEWYRSAAPAENERLAMPRHAV
jgi:3-isopropylmalate dehydratase small subunit